MRISGATRRIGQWIGPPLLALVLYWSGLTAWFQKDDFAWLQLRNLLASGRSIWWILFEPLAQGTIRTLSERLYFLSFYEFFGLHALPYHLALFAIFLIALTLLQSVAAKLTGSAAAGFWAAILWVVNAALATPLAWVSGMDEVMFAGFFLLDLWLLLRYLETGDNRFYAAQCATFVLGFGVIELNVVYPAVALIVVLIRAPRESWKIAWLFPVSALYAILHSLAAPLPESGAYRMQFDAQMIRTLATYLNWSLGTGWLRVLNLDSFALRASLATPLMLGLAAFLVRRIRERQWIALLFPAIFVIVLAPLLPLRDHMEYEYLTVPVIGLAMLGGWALASANRLIAIPLAAIYVAVSIPVGHSLTATLHDRSVRLQKIFYAVDALHRAHPTKMAIFTGASKETFDDMIDHHAFALIGIPEACISSRDHFGGEFAIDAATEQRAIEERRAVVYDLHDGVRELR
ncbi:MAG: hypothetical protein LAO79_15505 [Acidobacteriia bacterium]|nr:hypothetical protein [Terriglobia bacterium]